MITSKNEKINRHKETKKSTKEERYTEVRRKTEGRKG